jgi:ketosteroid isomerase-like protein
VTLTCPVEIVRLMFEARAAGDVNGWCLFLHPEVEMTTVTGQHLVGAEEVRAFLSREARRIETHAHRIVQSEHGATVYGRMRIVDHGSLVDSPAVWHFRLTEGLVRGITPLPSGT